MFILGARVDGPTKAAIERAAKGEERSIAQWLGMAAREKLAADAERAGQKAVPRFTFSTLNDPGWKP